MDIASLTGLVLGFGLVVYSILSISNLGTFVDIPSLAVVIGGAIGAVLVNHPLKDVLGVVKVVQKAFIHKELDEVGSIDTLVNLALKARMDGILAVDAELGKIENPFMRTGLEMAVDGAEEEAIRQVMETELYYTTQRHDAGKKIFSNLGMFAPAFGMVGTLIGLVAMLQSLDDPSTIGPSMSVALITTFYGSLFANLVFLPLAGKLEMRSAAEVIMNEMIIEGVIAIQTGEHPKTIRKKLLNYLPPSIRNAESEGEQEA